VNVEYMTTAEVAELCRTSAESVRWWRHVGRGPRSFRVGRRVLYETTEVRQWLAALKAGGESAGDHGRADDESTRKADRRTQADVGRRIPSRSPSDGNQTGSV